MKKRITTIIIVFFAIIKSVAAYEYESELFEKRFACKEGDKLSVVNRGGDITVNTWERDEMKVEYIIKITSNKENNIDKILDFIEVQFSQSQGIVKVETEVDRKAMTDLHTRDLNSLSYKVSYKISAPDYISLDIKNSRRGNLNINDFIGSINTDIRYGNATLTNTNSPDVKLNAYNGDISIKNCGENTESIDITSKYGNIAIDGYYDNLKIDTYNGNVDVQNRKLGVGKISVQNRYGNVILNGYSKEIDIDIYNGNINVNGDLNAESTNLKNKYGKIVFKGKSKNIAIESYNGNVDVANESIHGNINIANKYGEIKYIGRFEEMKLSNYNANINVENTGSSAGNANITTKYGNIKYVGYAKEISLENYNGNIDVGNKTSSKIENLRVASAYGHVHLNNIENINITTTNNDTYNILNSNSITIDDAKYTSFNIDGLKESFITRNQLKFGKINIRKIDPHFKNIQISNHYSAISLYFKQLNQNAIDISSKFGKIKIADAFKEDVKVLEDKSNFTVKKNGTAGSIIIDNQYGNIILDTE